MQVQVLPGAFVFLFTMKKFIYLFLLLFFIFLFLGIGFYVFLNIKGKEILLNTLEKKYKIKAELRNLYVNFPLKVKLEGFIAPRLSFSLLEFEITGVNLFRKVITLDNIYLDELELVIKRKKDGRFLFPLVSERAKGGGYSTIGVNSSSKKDNFFFIFKKIFVDHTSLTFLDENFSPPLKLQFKNARIKLKNFNYPMKDKFYVELASSLKAKNIFMEDFLKFKGWIDRKNKNMDVELKIRDYDYFAFADYYPPFWKPENLELKEAYLSLDAKAVSLNNEMKIDGILYLDRYAFLKSPQESSRVESLTKIINLFKKDEKGRHYFRFPTLKTRMDKLEIDFSSVWKDLAKRVEVSFANAILDFLNRTANQMIEKGTKEIKRIGVDTPVETIKGIFDILEGLIFPKKEEKEDKKDKDFLKQLQDFLKNNSK